MLRAYVTALVGCFWAGVAGLGVLEIAQMLTAVDYGRASLDHNSPLLLYRWVFPWDGLGGLTPDLGETVA